jgi:hypothetical protein
MDTVTGRGGPALDTIAYAKNPAHERFIQNFDGKLKGRYVIGFLVGVEFLGGAPLRGRIEAELGNPHYAPDEWVAARDMVIIFDRAVRAGVAVERIGELVTPAYKRSHPEAFAGRTIHDAFDILEGAYRQDTTYGGVSPGIEKAPGLVRVHRLNSPIPCACFSGVIKGLLQTFGVLSSVHEIACQWEGAHSCCWEARWNLVPSARGS